MAKKSSITEKQWEDLATRAFKRLDDLIDCVASDDPKLLPAIKEVLDRAYGKPREQHEITGKDGKDLFIRREDVEASLLNLLSKKNKNDV